MKKKYKVFVLEDSDIQITQIAQNLMQDDRKIILAESIREAKEIYNHIDSDIDLFILDLKLPDGDGIDFLKYVRKSSGFVPTIIESGFITQNIKNNAAKLGIVAYFQKPIITSEFNQTVSILLPEKNQKKSTLEKGSKNVNFKIKRA